MARKVVLVLVLASMITGGGLFAQEEYADIETVHKHQPFDMLLGLNFGMGATPNLSKLFSEDGIPKGNYALIVDFGLTYDFYLFYWLSFNTGIMFHEDVYAILEQDFDADGSFTDIAATPTCITIPIGAHFNIPKVEWLYAGIGLTLNIPVASLLDSADPSFKEIDTKGPFFVGLPIDIGFDFVRVGRGGARFFFRITPEFHKKGTVVPIGFIWQINNWKLYGRN